MKLWVDDVRPAPIGYKWVRSVNEAISEIESNERAIQRQYEYAQKCFDKRDYSNRTKHYMLAKGLEIIFIDIDHDAGEYTYDGGDYIKLLDWLEETGRSYPIRIHSMNPVGIINMRKIIERNGWKEVK